MILQIVRWLSAWIPITLGAGCIVFVTIVSHAGAWKVPGWLLLVLVPVGLVTLGIGTRRWRALYAPEEEQ